MTATDGFPSMDEIRAALARGESVTLTASVMTTQHPDDHSPETIALEAMADGVAVASERIMAAARLIADAEEDIEAVQIVLDARRKATGLIK